MRGKRIVAALMILAAFFIACAIGAVFAGEHSAAAFLEGLACYMSVMAVFLFVYMSEWK